MVFLLFLLSWAARPIEALAAGWSNGEVVCYSATFVVPQSKKAADIENEFALQFVPFIPE
jgi:hypothetical protein